MFKTPLHAWHVANGARMVPFAGWDMPVQYTGILEEHHHTRSKASLFDICHMGEFMLIGGKARDALSGILTHDLSTLGPGRCRYGFMLNDEGGVLDDLIVYCMADDKYMMVVNGARVKSDFAWLKSHLPEDMYFEDISEMTAKIDLQGPEACKVLNSFMGEDWSFLPYFCFRQAEFEDESLIISRTGYTGELGYELYVREEKALHLWEKLLANPLVKPAGLGARDTLRLEMGMALYGQDLDENHTPTEAGMGFFLKSKADYVGKDKAALERESLLPLALPGRRAARHDDPVFLPSGEEVGRVTSGSFAPSLGHSVALAYVRAEYKDQTDFLLGKGPKKLEARKADLPFYKEGTARIKL
ncbi:glycine cleavage system aminomethyltransferase GcvT [Desulfocurvus sp. DL9XJH121]